jgi:hypothetical protein
MKKPSEVLPYLSNFTEGILLTIGAGDIDRIVASLKDLLTINLTD